MNQKGFLKAKIKTGFDFIWSVSVWLTYEYSSSIDWIGLELGLTNTP